MKRSRMCFDIANTNAAARIKPYGPALAIAARIRNANQAMDAHAKGGIVCEPVRTSFDDLLPGMPPALKLST